MNKKILIAILAIGLIIAGSGMFVLNNQRKQAPASLSLQNNKINPSEALIEYSDPSGFTFSYPDNLSIKKNEVDDTTYADLQLTSNQVKGGLQLKIADSTYKSLDEWTKSNKLTSLPPKEVALGKLKALEITTSEKLYLGALDQGILFTIEVPLVEKEFWMKVYNKLLSDFSFAPPQENTTDSSSDSVSFEGEEVVQ